MSSVCFASCFRPFRVLSLASLCFRHFSSTTSLSRHAIHSLETRLARLIPRCRRHMTETGVVAQTNGFPRSGLPCVPLCSVPPCSALLAITLPSPNLVFCLFPDASETADRDSYHRPRARTGRRRRQKRIPIRAVTKNEDVRTLGV